MAKPFNLEDAKAGKTVITRDGKKVTLFAFNRKGVQPIVGLIDIGKREDPTTWALNGVCGRSGEESNLDLVMAPTEVTLWLVYNPVTLEVHPDLFVEMNDAVSFTSSLKGDWKMRPIKEFRD